MTCPTARGVRARRADNRYFMIYDTARSASSTILDVCVAARTELPLNDRRCLFVYLNLMHCSAYVALTPVYTKENFMDTFCQEHHIEVPARPSDLRPRARLRARARGPLPSLDEGLRVTGRCSRGRSISPRVCWLGATADAWPTTRASRGRLVPTQSAPRSTLVCRLAATGQRTRGRIWPARFDAR